MVNLLTCPRQLGAWVTLSLTTVACMLAIACRADTPALTGDIRVDGSSTVVPLTRAITVGFAKESQV